MEKATLMYLLYMGFFALLMGAVFLTPLLAFDHDMNDVYTGFSYACHQKLSRSICLFKNETYWMADCTNQTGQFVNSIADRTTIRTEVNGVIGYKMPVCSRDIGIYGAMLLAGAFYPFVKEIKDRKVYPGIFLILAMVPMGLDGGIQLLSEIGLLPFLYESSNTLRLLTGGIAGVVAAFYAIPILVNFVYGHEKPFHRAKKKSG